MKVESEKNFPRILNQKVHFGAGKVKLYADFDGTYLPAQHKTISQAKSRTDLPQLDNYFSQVKTFLDLNKSGFKLIVTTGRNLGEFHSIVNHFRRLGLQMPLPDSVIVKNGGDEYIKRMSDEVYYASDSKPYVQANEEKRESLKNQLGWDGQLIRSKIIESLKKHDFHIRKDLTTNSAEDYGSESSLYHVSDHYDRDGSLSPWVSVLREDGDLKFFIGLPKDMQHRSDRKNALEKIQKQLEQDLKEICKNAGGSSNFSIRFKPTDSEYGNHPSLTVAPKINGHELTKVYDTQKAVREAIQNNDFIITAGDGSNDFEMLNPGRYIKLPPALEMRNKADHFVDNPTEFLKVLQENPEVKRQFDALPFLGIVIERNHSLPRQLQALVNAYSTSNTPKILKVKEGELFDGVVKGTLRHLTHNPEFASAIDTVLMQSLPKFKKMPFLNYVPSAHEVDKKPTLKRATSVGSFFVDKFNFVKKK